MPLLFWAGGTYARRPEDFPQEQSPAAWLEEFLLPLELKAPVFEWHASLEDLAKYWDDYTDYIDAKDVPRDDPWSYFQR